MKKTLTFYLVITAILISIFTIAAGAESPKIDTGEIAFDSEPITRSHEIIPTIELNNPGLIKVTISWTTPKLTFVKIVGGTYHPNVSYYGLSLKVEVPFHIVNESSVGTETSFNGNIVVTPSHTWQLESETAAQNISIRPQIFDQVINIPLGDSDDSYILEYSNNLDFAKNCLALTLTANQIRDIMKVQVSFKIQAAPIKQ